MNAVVKTQRYEMSEASINELSNKATGFVMGMIKNLAPRFLQMAEQVFCMATEVNDYVESYKLVDFRGMDTSNGGYTYKYVTFLVEGDGNEVLPIDRLQLNTLVREMAIRLEIGMKHPESENAVTTEELFGMSLEKDPSELSPFERARLFQHLVEENLDLIHERLLSGELNPEKVGATGGMKRVTISSAEELVPAVAQFYMSVLSGGHSSVSVENFFEGCWCITGIVSVLDIHLLGEMEH